MDLTQLLPVLVSMLSPFIPTLVETAKSVGGTLSDKALEKVGESIGEEGVKHAKPLLARLWPKIAEKPVALEAAKDLAVAPKDNDLQAVFRVQLKKVLEADPNLLDEVKKIVEEAEKSGANIRINVTGDRNVVVGRDNSGTIVTGDSNKIEK